LAGNIIGGSFIFALISHAQIRSESGTPKEEKKVSGKNRRTGDEPEVKRESTR
jgi:hypothetical protein